MSAADHRIDRDALAQTGAVYALAHGVNHAKKLVPDRAWILRKRVMAAIDVAVRTADPRQRDFDANFTRAWLRKWPLFNHQFVRLLNHYAFHRSLLVYQFHSVPSSRRATGR